jgi:hypothetical protein
MVWRSGGVEWLSESMVYVWLSESTGYGVAKLVRGVAKLARCEDIQL